MSDSEPFWKIRQIDPLDPSNPFYEHNKRVAETLEKFINYEWERTRSKRMKIIIGIDAGLGEDAKQREHEVRHEIEQILAKGESFDLNEDEAENVPDEDADTIVYIATYIYGRR